MEQYNAHIVATTRRTEFAAEAAEARLAATARERSKEGNGLVANEGKAARSLKRKSLSIIGLTLSLTLSATSTSYARASKSSGRHDRW